MANKTKKLFDEAVIKMARVVKILNEEVEDPSEVMDVIDKLNDEISDIQIELRNGKNDFLKRNDLSEYPKILLGKDYFFDKRCWSYLYDALYDVYWDMPNYIDDFEESKKVNNMGKKLKESDILQKTVDEWFDYLDDLFDFKQILKDYGYDVKKVQKALNKEFMYGESNFDFFVTKLGRYLDDDILVNEIFNKGNKANIKSLKRMQTGLGMAQVLPTNVMYRGGITDLYNERRNKTMNKKLTEKRGNEEDEKLALAQFEGVDVDEIENGYSDHVYEVNGDEYWVSDYDTAYDQAVEDVQNFLEYDMGLEGVSESTQEYALEHFCTFDWESDLHSFNESYCNDIKSEYDNEYGSRLVQECDNRVGLDDEDGGYVLTFEDGNGDTMYVYDKKSYGDDVDKAERFLTESNAFDFDTSNIEDKLTEEFGEDFEFDCSAEFEEDLVDFDDLSEKLTEELDKDYNSMAEWFDSIYGSSWVSEMRDTLKDYIDWEALAEYIVDIDGVANTLARYDGRENEEEVNGVDYYIYRM